MNKIAQAYLPYFMADEAEPFAIEAIGYTVFETNEKSKSCKRTFHLDKEHCQYLIEYAVFYDWDIQHLYDLEHVFVYVGYEGEVIDVEASFHGKFLKAMVNNTLAFHDKTHPIVYMQPGKHAMMSNPDYFHLFIGLKEACMEDAGCDGFLVAPMFEDRLQTSAELNEMVRRYIRSHYTFVPTEHYQPITVSADKLMPYAELENLVVGRMKDWVNRIREADES